MLDTEIITVDKTQPEKKKIRRAAQIIKKVALWLSLRKRFMV